MGYKKHNWNRYGRQGEIVKIEVCDNTERRIEKFMCNDSKSFSNALKVLSDKYGFNQQDDSVEKDDVESEIDWLRKDMKWDSKED